MWEWLSNLASTAAQYGTTAASAVWSGLTSLANAVGDSSGDAGFGDFQNVGELAGGGGGGAAGAGAGGTKSFGWGPFSVSADEKAAGMTRQGPGDWLGMVKHDPSEIMQAQQAQAQPLQRMMQEGVKGAFGNTASDFFGQWMNDKPMQINTSSVLRDLMGRQPQRQGYQQQQQDALPWYSF